MNRFLFAFLMFMLPAAWTCASEEAGVFIKKTFVSSDGSLPYNELDPVGMKKGKKYPVVLFLHGAGSRGTDNALQITVAGGLFLNPSNQEKYPAYVLFPQCPEKNFWTYDDKIPNFKDPMSLPADFEESHLMRLVVSFLRNFLATHEQADPSRVYVMGISMGGMATYDICIRHPELFAAAVPMCGNVNPSRLASAKNIPFAIYHGDHDETVPVSGSREAYKALRAAGAKVKYKEFVGVDHACWYPTLNEPDLLEWLFKQKKK